MNPMHKLLKKIPVRNKWKLAIKTVPLVTLIILIKLLVHHFGYESLTLNSLFTAIISANIFLISFLISGVLVDYKESEKLPGEIASSLSSMSDEGFIIYQNKKSPESKAYLHHLITFHQALIKWFHKEERTTELTKKITKFNDYFLAFESQTTANFIVRIKQEQNNVRKCITRIHTIRETAFLGTGYAIAEIITFILSIGLILVKIDPFYESIFFVSFVSFILIYMIFFIKDLDNPFGYTKEDSLVEDVSLKPVYDSLKYLEEQVQALK